MEVPPPFDAAAFPEGGMWRCCGAVRRHEAEGCSLSKHEPRTFGPEVGPEHEPRTTESEAEAAPPPQPQPPAVDEG